MKYQFEIKEEIKCCFWCPCYNGEDCSLLNEYVVQFTKPDNCPLKEVE